MKQPKKPSWKKKALAFIGAVLLGGGSLLSNGGTGLNVDVSGNAATADSTASFTLVNDVQANENIIHTRWSGKLNYLSNEFNGGAWPGVEIIEHETNWVYDIVAQKNLPALHAYLNSGGDLHVNSEAVLRMAATTGAMNIVQFAVESGADVSAMQNQAVRIASMNGHQDIVKYLLDKGADKAAAANPTVYKTTPGPKF